MIGLFSNDNFDTVGRSLMKRLIKPQSKVICFSASDIKWQKEHTEELMYDGKYFNERYRPFREYGVEKEDFYIVNPHDSEGFVKWKFKQADIVYFSGGDMLNLEILLKKYGLWYSMPFYKNEKSFIGVSAGALISLEIYDVTPHVDENYTTYYKQKGLGLVNDIRLLVHFNKQKEEHMNNLEYVFKEMINDMCDTGNDYTLVALSDDQGVIIDNNGDWYVN